MFARSVYFIQIQNTQPSFSFVDLVSVACLSVLLNFFSIYLSLYKRISLSKLTSERSDVRLLYSYACDVRSVEVLMNERDVK